MFTLVIMGGSVHKEKVKDNKRFFPFILKPPAYLNAVSVLPNFTNHLPHKNFTAPANRQLSAVDVHGRYCAGHHFLILKPKDEELMRKSNKMTGYLL